jgi:hypothetical protein
MFAEVVHIKIEHTGDSRTLQIKTVEYSNDLEIALLANANRDHYLELKYEVKHRTGYNRFRGKRRKQPSNVAKHSRW